MPRFQESPKFVIVIGFSGAALEKIRALIHDEIKKIHNEVEKDG